jgi:hypothetical protein
VVSNAAQPAVRPTAQQTSEQKRLEEEALGGDRKAWDPLGAL